ncbi:MarR family transcriptional regulator [Streptomyces sp. F001]|uniref:MarR family winged helix-turn-helix transcriptional regulator n=1 Tax=Streptomyces sp. F001 TaxID=1510026 RepID=UPI00101E4C4E|nr:MarR family transcriptional regulator [Streptomyces sp. F001]
MSKGRAEARVPRHDTTGADAGPMWLRSSIAPKLRLAAKESRAFFEAELGRSGITFATWTVLATLKLEGPMIQRRLAEYLSIEGPTLTRHLETMERRGIVLRTRSGADRRAVTVELTPEGDAMYSKIESIALRSHERMLEGISDSEIAQLSRLLEKILANVTTE